MNGKQSRHWPDSDWRSSLIKVYTVCPDLSVGKLRNLPKLKFIKTNIPQMLCFDFQFDTACCYTVYISLVSRGNTLSLIKRKAVFGCFFDQVRLKPACSGTEISQRLEISYTDTRCIILSRQWTTKALIRLCGCTGWSASLLFAYAKSMFSHGKAQFSTTTICDTCGT